MAPTRWHDRSEGASSIEYAILVTLVAVMVIAAVVLVGRQVQADFDCAEHAIYEAPDGCDGS